MKPSTGAVVHNTPTSSYWEDEEGIVCAVSRPGPKISIEERKQQLEKFQENLGNKKICMIVDITNAGPPDRETQNFNSEYYPNIFKAIAFVSRSAFGKMLGHLYLGMRPTPFPIKIFSTEDEARKWIRTHL